MVNVNYFRQENEYFCGHAIVKMLVPEAGQDALAYLLKTNPVTGTSHLEIKEMLEIFGFCCKENFGVEPLLSSNGTGTANLICYIEPEEQEGHFAFMKEMDSDTVTLIDPYYGENHRISRSYFMNNWRGESTPPLLVITNFSKK